MFIKNANENADSSVVEVGSGYNNYAAFKEKYDNSLSYHDYLKLNASKGLNKLKMVFLLIIRLITSRTALKSSKKAVKWILKLSGFMFIGNAIVNLYEPVTTVYKYNNTLLSFFVKDNFSRATFLTGKNIAEIKRINFQIMKIDTFINQNTFIFLIATMVLFYLVYLTRNIKTKYGDRKLSRIIWFTGLITFLIPSFNFLRFYFYQEEVFALIEIAKDIIPFI